MCISCIKEEVSNHFLFLCLYLLCKLYHNIIQALCYNHFNNSIKIKVLISGRYGLENRLLVEATHLCRRSIQKRLSVHLYIHISVVGNIISSATLEDLIADLDEDDEFVEIIKNLNINDTYTSEEASGEVYIRVSYAH